jgi:hypothetical protein
MATEQEGMEASQMLNSAWYTFLDPNHAAAWGWLMLRLEMDRMEGQKHE